MLFKFIDYKFKSFVNANLSLVDIRNDLNCITLGSFSLATNSEIGKSGDAEHEETSPRGHTPGLTGQGTHFAGAKESQTPKETTGDSNPE